MKQRTIKRRQIEFDFFAIQTPPEDILTENGEPIISLPVIEKMFLFHLRCQTDKAFFY